MIRIKTIVDLIDKCDLVIDIGSDHAYTAVQLLTQHKTNFVVNVESHIDPLNQGISNLTKYQILNKTLNIVNDGLLNIDQKIPMHIFDYGVISGLGAKTIIKILSGNTIAISHFVLQPNNHEELLRAWLLANGYSIIKEQIVIENEISYMIFKVSKARNFLYYSRIALMLGHKKTLQTDQNYYTYLVNKLTYLQKIQDNNNIHKFKHEIDFLTRRIKWYKQKQSTNN